MPYSAQTIYTGIHGLRTAQAKLPAANLATTWQTIVMPPRYPDSGETTGGSGTSRLRRVDAAQLIAAPRFLSWSMDIASFRDSKSSEFQTQASNFEPQTASELNGRRRRIDPPTDLMAERQDREYARLINLIAEAAHDVRSPIAAASQIISTVTTRLRENGGILQGDLELLDVANLRLVQANSWAEGILLDRSLDQGSPVAVRSRFYPGQWKEIIEPLLESIAAQRDVRLSWVGWERSLPKLYLDANHLSRSVLNLVTNAAQASSPGDEISIRVDWQRNVSQRLAITVEDHGVGLPAGLVQQVNSVQAWPTQSVAARGGLGLRTAKALVQGMGGSIVAHSPPDRGTHFRITLPTDNPVSLIRSWLIANASERSEMASLPCTVSVHAVRVRGLDMAFADTQMQQAAGAADLVYRVAKDRWLWLAITKRGEPARKLAGVQALLNDLNAKQPVCLSRSIRSLNLSSLPSLAQRFDGRNLLATIVHQLADTVDQLMSGKVAPVDELYGRDKAIMVRPVRKYRRQPLLRADASSQPQPHLQDRSRNPSTFDHQFSEALSELAEQWQADQQKLDRGRAMRVDAPERGAAVAKQPKGRPGQPGKSSNHSVQA